MKSHENIAAESSMKIPIVLTATIKPLAPGVSGMAPEVRLAEYRQVVQFCQQFAPVYFLENSDYDLERHSEFAESSRLQVRRFPRSVCPERGKGYQEFEMLDTWLSREPNPPARWLKITGRYQVLNLPAILNECRQAGRCSLLIDQSARRQFARTYLFFTTSAFYRENLAGLYRRCDDRTGDWIERILYDELGRLLPSPICCFRNQPRIHAVAGSTGAAFPTGVVRWRIKQVLRRFNRIVDERRLWYAI